jgi:hypothetical protein
MVNDSSEMNYSILVLNNDGKRLWSRTYTGKGDVANLSETADHQILITGNNWRAKIGPKGYLIWESIENVNDSLVSSLVMPGGDIYYFGFRNSSSLLLIKTGADNKTIFIKELALPENISQIRSVLQGNQNQIIMLIEAGDVQMIAWINASTGDVLKTAVIPAALNITALLRDQSNNLLLTGCENGLLLIKNNGLAF